MAPFPTIKSKHSLVAKHVTEEVSYLTSIGKVTVPK